MSVCIGSSPFQTVDCDRPRSAIYKKDEELAVSLEAAADLLNVDLRLSKHSQTQGAEKHCLGLT